VSHVWLLTSYHLLGGLTNVATYVVSGERGIMVGSTLEKEVLLSIAQAEIKKAEFKKQVARAEEDRDFFSKLGLEYTFIRGTKLA
jgi:hypothetical protein